MAYTTPYNVWERLGRITRRQQTVSTLEQGDVIQLEQHIIPDKTVVRDGTGTEVPDTDYSQDTDFNQLTYTGSSTLSDVTVNYMTAPGNHDRALRAVSQAENYVDNHLNLTFGGLKRRVEEVYQTDGAADTFVMPQRQPVRNVETVWINEDPTDQSPPNWVELTQDEDWIQEGKTGFKLSSNVATATGDTFYPYRGGHDHLSQNPKQVRVTYTYGFENVPGDIQNLTEILLMTDFFHDTVFGAGIDGRDNFDPQTLSRYHDKRKRIEREWVRRHYDNFTTLVTEGTEEDVQ